MCSMYERDSDEAVKLCRALLTDPDCDRAVRYGDIYGMMAEHYARLQQWKAVSFHYHCNIVTLIVIILLLKMQNYDICC